MTILEAGRRRALVVATSDYEDSLLPGLGGPGNDAAELILVLNDPTIGGYEVTPLYNPRLSQLMRTIEELCTSCLPNDLLLIYLSCHGLLNHRGHLYYAATDTRENLLASTGLAADWLNDQLRMSRARKQVLLLDCCHSGAFAADRKGLGPLSLGRFQGLGRAVLTASSSTEMSFEALAAQDTVRRSVFTEALITGLRTGDADADEDGLIGIAELYRYVHHAVTATEHPQTPQFWLDGGVADIIVGFSPRHGSGPGLPSELRENIYSPRPATRIAAVRALGELLAAGSDLASAARLELIRVTQEDIPAVAATAFDQLHPENPEDRPPVRGQDYFVTTVFTPEQAAAGAVLKLRIDDPDGGTREVTARVPGGLHEGSKIHIKGHGGQGKPGDLPGDIIVIAHVREVG